MNEKCVAFVIYTLVTAAVGISTCRPPVSDLPSLGEGGTI